MKKILSCFLLFIPALTGISQPASKFAGTWQGILNVGTELRIVFHIKEDGKGGFTSTADSPDQSAYGMPCDKTTVKDNEVTISMSDLNASYSGRLVNDSTIEGTFTQGADLRLTLKKTQKTETKERKRPQTPQPPYPYRSEDVEYGNEDKTLSYGATITIPEGKGPFPAAVLITGSGPQNRDEEIMGHKLFAVIADHLTRKGFVILRVDDRGVGKSTGDFSKATSQDFANDVSSSFDYLLTRPEVDKKKAGLIGHSEGGMIAPMVAVKRKDVDFIVLLAGPGVPVIELMAEQNEAIARSAGLSDKALAEIKPLYRQIVMSVLDAPDSASAASGTYSILENWYVNKDKDVLEELNMATTEQRIKYVSEMVKTLQSPWFRYFLRFDPGQYIEQLKCKVLALNGDKDIQVISRQNLPGIEASLKKSRSKNYEIKELHGLNHLFQACKECTVPEYGELEETISPVALEAISKWLEKM
jgi:pimeloyl-ACP methyl ester carboxylesterase